MKRNMINMTLQRYGTRMLTAGDTFECSRRDAKVLHALKKARYVTEEDRQAANGDVDDLAELRAEYQAKLGKRAFHGWSAAELREKIAAGPTGES